ncbi:VOC family protein [uncultured Methylobacterium sp.]|uniref:VOC family protein n=1 Tax=uncultured Methylobacterium sp. TaxID=157278 RepID=UPI00259A3BB5|nr:VOC family protein [uncultured Methylobacterium sp.]
MKLGYVILYVPDLAASVAFYGRAFGLAPRFVQDGGHTTSSRPAGRRWLSRRRGSSARPARASASTAGARRRRASRSASSPRTSRRPSPGR